MIGPASPAAFVIPGGVTGAVLLPLLGAGGPIDRMPRLVWYGPEGARTELSTTSLANWSAKVAGLLVDELGLPAGELVAVPPPLGWLAVPIVLGSWWAGLVVTPTDNDGGAAVAFVPEGGAAGAGVADDVYVVSGHPLAAPSRSVPPGQQDFTSAVLRQADRFGPARSVSTSAPALCADAHSLSVADLLDAARRTATEVGPGARVLCASVPLPQLAWLGRVLGVLLAGGTLVQLDPQAPELREPDRLAALAAAERTTVTLGLP